MNRMRTRRIAGLLGIAAASASLLSLAGCGQNDMPQGSGNGKVFYYTGVMRSKADLMAGNTGAGNTVSVAQSADVRHGS